MSTIEDAKLILERDSGKGNVYDHISKVILKVLQQNQADPIHHFENISLSIKDELNQMPKQTSELLLACSSSMLTALKSQKSVGEEHDIQNVVSDAGLLDWSGLSFTQEEIFFVQNLMYKLVQETQEENPIAKVRFWGKLLTCTGKDYIVFECVDQALNEISPGLEGRDGANKYAYYVLSDGKMSRLPDVEETHLVYARTTRKYLTGKLNVEVSGYPLFPGKEAHYLRALISLISSDTAVAPISFFGLNEEEDIVSKMDNSEEEIPEKLLPENVANLDSWAYIQRCINSMGRMRNPKIDGEDGEVEDPKYASATLERETPLAPLSDGSSRWNSSVFLNAASHDIGVLRSCKWPGAVAVSVVGQVRFVNCYVGYGMATMSDSYTPPSLPSLQMECDQKLDEMTDIIDQPIVAAEEGNEE